MLHYQKQVQLSHFGNSQIARMKDIFFLSIMPGRLLPFKRKPFSKKARNSVVYCCEFFVVLVGTIYLRTREGSRWFLSLFKSYSSSHALQKKILTGIGFSC